MGVVDGRWMGAWPHPRSPHSYQKMFGMLSSPPHPKVHDLSHKLHRIEGRPTYLFSLQWP